MAADQPVVEVLYLPGCPNHAGAVALVNRVRAELRLDVEVRVREISDPRAASRARFLGSPTIRVDGRDVEPGAEARTDYALACRVYRTGGMLARQPDEQWVRDALARAASMGVICTVGRGPAGRRLFDDSAPTRGRLELTGVSDEQGVRPGDRWCRVYR